MPHSVPPIDPKDSMDQDSTLPDAPPACAEGCDTQDKDDFSGPNAVVPDQSNTNVQLEDLFDEDDDDDEFPSSGVSKEDVPSSSPPPSPLYADLPITVANSPSLTSASGKLHLLQSTAIRGS